MSKKIVISPTKLDNTPIPYKSKYVPQPAAPIIPRNFFCFLSIGVRGSGKTFAIVKMIYWQERSPTLNEDGERMAHRTILFCPTYDNNTIYHSLKSLSVDDVVADYTPAALNEKRATVAAEYTASQEYIKVKKLLKKYKVEGEKNMTTEELALLAASNFELPAEPKYPNGCITHVIFDDLVGTTAFTTSTNNPLTNFVIKGRHEYCNIYITGQSLMAIPRTIRGNSTVFTMYKFADVSVLKNLQEVIGGILTPEEFEALYKRCTKERYSFLYIDGTVSPPNLYENFTKKIKIVENN